MSERISVARLPARAGLGWLVEGMGWLRQAPVPWLGLGATALLALLLLNLVPVLGGMLSTLLMPFWAAAFMAASRDASQGRPVTVLHLRAGFDGAPQALFMIAVVNLAGTLLIGQWLLGDVSKSLQPLLMSMHTGGHMAEIDPAEAERMAALASAALPSLLLALLLMIPLLMATWFAPALVLFNGFPPLRALWWSLWAVWVNPAASLSYALMLAAIWMLALMIPLGLGLMLAFPWAMVSTYAAYRAIFDAPPAA